MDKKITTVGSLKSGNYVILDGVACVVKSVQTSRPGKHGHAKCRIEATSMMGNQKKIVVIPAHDKIDVPIIQKKDAQVLSVHEGKASIMDLESFETFDVTIPSELHDQVVEGKTVVYWKVFHDNIIKQVK